MALIALMLCLSFKAEKQNLMIDEYQGYHYMFLSRSIVHTDRNVFHGNQIADQLWTKILLEEKNHAQ